MTGRIAALDLGGTHASAGRVDLGTSTVDARVRIALPAGAGRDELLERIVGTLAGAVEGTERLGVAVPGPFDYERGVSRIEHKLESLHGVDLRAALTDAFDIPPRDISFVNDAEAFALGEWWSGAAVGERRVVGITLGTGLGSAFLEDGRAVGSDPRVPPEGAMYLLSHRGAPVERTISRAALIERYGRPGVDVDEIAARARAGDARALAAFSGFARALGDVLEPWLRAFEATCVVVGGSIAHAWDLLAPDLGVALERLPALQTIARAARPDDAALLGAALDAVGGPDRRGRRPALDPEVTELRRELVASGARPLHQLTVEQARAGQATVEPSVLAQYDVDVVDLPAPVPIRLFRGSVSAPAPVCIWLPGGGWVLDTHAASEPTCARIAAEAPCAVAAVRYRLAPEHRFPAAVEDAVAATRWILAEGSRWGLDSARVAIGGTSAGANLAAAAALHERDCDHPPFALQVLVYPALDYRADTASMRDVGDWVFLDRPGVEWCWSHYLGENDGDDPLASPLQAIDLSGLPRALVVTAELDPLRDEGELYARRLREAGVPARALRFGGVPHGFFSLAGRLGAADRAQRLVVTELRDAFSLS